MSYFEAVLQRSQKLQLSLLSKIHCQAIHIRNRWSISSFSPFQKRKKKLEYGLPAEMYLGYL